MESNINQLATSQSIEVMPAPSEAYIQEAERRNLDFMNPKRWQVMNLMAQTFIQSGALPATISNAPQLIMVFQAGFEAGLQPIEALNSFYFVKGKIAMYGDTVISQVQKAGHIIEWGQCDHETATVTITRGDTGKSFSQTITMAMVKARRWNMSKDGEKDVWTKYPESMLRYRAFGMCARFIVPDALRGIGIREELEGEIDEDTANKKDAKNIATAEVVDKPATTIGHKSLQEALSKEPEAEKAAEQEEVSEPQKKTTKAKAKLAEEE